MGNVPHNKGCGEFIAKTAGAFLVVGLLSATLIFIH